MVERSMGCRGTHTSGLKLQLCYLLAAWLSHVTSPHLQKGDQSKHPVLEEWRECCVHCPGRGGSQRWPPRVTDYNPENPRSECIHFLPSMLYYTEGIYFSWVSHSFVEVPSSSWKSIFSASYWESEKWYKSEWMRIPPTKVIYFKSVMMQVGFLSFVSPYFRTIGGGRESTLVGDPLGSEWLLSLYCGKIRVRVQLTI